MRWEAEKCPRGHHPTEWDPERGGELLHVLELRKHLCPACEVVEKTEQAEQDSGLSDYPGTFTVWAPAEPLPGDG